MDTRSESFELRLQGLTYAAIASRLGISRQRVQQLVRPPKEIYRQVLDRADGRCQNCGVTIKGGHVHHVKIEDHTPDTFNDIENLAYLCISCHRLAHGAHDSHRSSEAHRMRLKLERTMRQSEAVGKITAFSKRFRSPEAAAKELGIGANHLRDILSKRRNIGPITMRRLKSLRVWQ